MKPATSPSFQAACCWVSIFVIAVRSSDWDSTDPGPCGTGGTRNSSAKMETKLIVCANIMQPPNRRPQHTVEVLYLQCFPAPNASPRAQQTPVAKSLSPQSLPR